MSPDPFLDDVLDDLARERELSTSLAVDLSIANAMLSEALTQLHAANQQRTDLIRQLRRCLGYPADDRSRQPLVPAIVADVDVPDAMVRAREIPWTSSDRR